MTTENKDSIPEEPDELAIWREIVAYRDELVRQIEAADTAQEFGARARAGAERGITGRLDDGERIEDYAERIERIGRNAEESVRLGAKAAEVKLRQLDTSLRAREGKEKKHTIAAAKKLRDSLREPLVSKAREAVVDYLKTKGVKTGREFRPDSVSTAVFVEATLFLSSLNGAGSLDDLVDVDGLIREGRLERKKGSGTHKDLASRVTNKVAGRRRRK
jgi:hypothetical protein